MHSVKSKGRKFAAFAGIFGALGCSAGAPGAEAQGENQGSNTAGGSPAAAALEWQLDHASANAAIVDGSQIERTPEQMQEGNLLYEIRLSDSKVVQFLETEPGDIAVSYTGSDALDAHPPDEFAELMPTQLFTRITGEAPPDRLVTAELATLDRDSLRMQSGVDDERSVLKDGPAAPGMTGAVDAQGRDFLESQWWVQTACSGAGINYHFWSGTEYYHRWVGCWANLYSWVSTGDLGITMDFRIVGDGTNGTAANLKYYYVQCDTFIITSCGWKSKNYGVTAGTWREVDFLGHQSRAVEYTHPTGGYFAVKYSGMGTGQSPGCDSPTFDCIYHNK